MMDTTAKIISVDIVTEEMLPDLLKDNKSDRQVSLGDLLVTAQIPRSQQLILLIIDGRNYKLKYKEFGAGEKLAPSFIDNFDNVVYEPSRVIQTIESDSRYKKFKSSYPSAHLGIMILSNDPKDRVNKWLVIYGYENNRKMNYERFIVSPSDLTVYSVSSSDQKPR